MSGKDRIEVFPSRMAQTIMKARLKGAQTGRNLLKKKSDALTMRFRQILKKIIETKMLMGEVMREAAFSLAEAKFTAGDFSTTVIQNVNKAQVKVRAKKDNVAGVTLPVFEHYQEGGDSYELTGLARGGEQLAKLKRNYAKAVELLVELASLQVEPPTVLVGSGIVTNVLVSLYNWSYFLPIVLGYAITILGPPLSLRIKGSHQYALFTQAGCTFSTDTSDRSSLLITSSFV
ncbi:hypothetical protein GDO81_014977 [Engystomops pustulosus]|uniref:V-type proton ATPase subunit D n=1 Tax=Engystomops pustulosus TaxID=76066 RepID=A0AAV7AK70_ENGPU|nr:hypothetical protein GDO81_014977 [Engystomops pustulosus]